MLFLWCLAPNFGDLPCLTKRVRVAASVEPGTSPKGSSFRRRFHRHQRSFFFDASRGISPDTHIHSKDTLQFKMSWLRRFRMILLRSRTMWGFRWLPICSGGSLRLYTISLDFFLLFFHNFIGVLQWLGFPQRKIEPSHLPPLLY